VVISAKSKVIKDLRAKKKLKEENKNDKSEDEGEIDIVI